MTDFPFCSFLYYPASASPLRPNTFTNLFFSNSLNIRVYYSFRLKDRYQVYIYVSIFSNYFASTTPPSNFWHWGMILVSHQSWQSATGCLNMTFWKAACAARWKSLPRCGKRPYYSWNLYVLLKSIRACYYILSYILY